MGFFSGSPNYLSASAMFGVPIEEITKGSPLRQKGKIAELALGYGGAVGALTSMGALAMGLSEDELPGLVSTWRNANPHITQFWWDVDEAAVRAVRERKETQVGLIRFQYAYRDRFFLPDKRNRNIIYSYKPRDGAEEAIYNLISDICISMKAEDYLSMPECLYHRVEVRMDEKEEKLYRQKEKDMLLPFEDGDVDAVNAAALSGKLLQMANGAVYDENHKVRHIHDKKLDALEDLIEAANGKPVLVAYWYQHDLDRIVERFKAVPLKAAGDIRKWKEGKIPVAAIHPASAGHGLNIQDGGHILIWFGLTWSLELYMQCNARLWRQGQRETVMIYHIINKGTLDEDAMRSLEQKDCGQSAIIDAVKARIGGVNGASRKDD